MATDDIDTLTGPELSAAVAREVMGWELWENCQWIMPGGDCWGDADDFVPHAEHSDSHRVLMRCIELNIAHETLKHLLTIDPTVICRAALRAVRASR